MAQRVTGYSPDVTFSREIRQKPPLLQPDAA